MCKFWTARLGFRLPCEGAVVHLEALGLHHPDVGGHPVPELHVDHVPDGELLRLDVQLLPVPDAEGVLGHHVGKAFHDLARLRLLSMRNKLKLSKLLTVDLVVGEDACDNDDSCEDDPKVQVVVRRLLIG